MMYFQERSNEAELMDDLFLDETVLKRALKDIAKVNQLLGGNRITLKAIDNELSKAPNQIYSILDVGCGSGNMLREVADYCRKKGYKVSLLGVDMNAKSLVIAKAFSKDYPEITYKKLDILQADNDLVETDILLCTLTLHHFNDSDIVRFLKRFQQITKQQIIINDLQRSKLAYVLFSIFSRIFLKTKVARIDGLISIKRSFTEDDLNHYASNASAHSNNIAWKWAFRYLWTITPNKIIGTNS